LLILEEKKGDYNLQESIPILEKNGFKLAVTTSGGFNKIGNENFALRRMGLSYEDTFDIFKFKISLGGFWQKSKYYKHEDSSS